MINYWLIFKEFIKNNYRIVIKCKSHRRVYKGWPGEHWSSQRIVTSKIMSEGKEVAGVCDHNFVVFMHINKFFITILIMLLYNNFII